MTATHFTTSMILAEDIQIGEAHRSACPCGCGFSHADIPASRLRILQTGAGIVLDTSRSIDGGRTFSGGGWQPCESAGGHAYAVKMAANRAPNCSAWLDANQPSGEEG